MAESDDDKEFLAFLKAYFKTEDVVLSRLPVGCTMKVYRLTVDGGPTWFCKRTKVSTEIERFLLALPDSSVLVPFVGKEHKEFKGDIVLIQEWCELKRIAVIDMDDTQFAAFLSSAKELFEILKKMDGGSPPNDEKLWWNTVSEYVSRHPIAGKVFGGLLKQGIGAYAYPNAKDLKLTHGDFHTDNFGFDDKGHVVFLDFDLILKALPTEDLTHLIVNGARHGRLVFDKKARNKLLRRYREMVEFFDFPRSEWRLALNRERLKVAAKMIDQKGDTVKSAREFLRRDWTVRKMYEVIERA